MAFLTNLPSFPVLRETFFKFCHFLGFWGQENRCCCPFLSIYSRSNSEIFVTLKKKRRLTKVVLSINHKKIPENQ